MGARPPESGKQLRTHELDSERRAAAIGSRSRGVSHTQTVYTALRDDIVRARLAPAQVVIEPELAERFGVSKTPVREALQILVAEGLVILIPRRGYVVRPLGLNDVREVLDLRAIIEPPLSAAATRNTSPEFIDDLRTIYHAQVAGSGTAELTDAARAFHERILDASRNSRARAVMGGLFDETTRSHHLIPAIGAHIHSNIEKAGHERVLDAIASGAPEAAESAMRAHLAELRKAVLEAFLQA